MEPLESGRATAKGTVAYAQRSGLPPGAYAQLGCTGLRVSRIGASACGIDDETAEHHQALVKAIQGGANVIASSGGESEVAIADAVEELMSGKRLRRDEFVVVSRAGTTRAKPGEHLSLYELPAFPEVVRCSRGVWHCIHPSALGHALEKTRQQSHLETIDVYLLHGPEMFLVDAHERSHGTLNQRRDELYRRLAEAFAWLEEQVTAGRVAYYGVSSGGWTVPPDSYQFVSLDRALRVAQQVGGAGHHFRCIETPLNLFESGACVERNQGRDGVETLLEAAASGEMAVLTVRPLEGHGRATIRLAELDELPNGVAADLQRQRVVDLEREYRARLASRLSESRRLSAFRFSEEITALDRMRLGPRNFQMRIQSELWPRLLQQIRLIDDFAGAENGQWVGWRDRYLDEVQVLLSAMRRIAVERVRPRVERLSRSLSAELPSSLHQEPLSRKALWAVASTPGVSCVLTGMRRPAYVDSSLSVLRWPRLHNVDRLYDAVRSAWGKERGGREVGGVL